MSDTSGGRRILGEGRWARLVDDNGWEFVERRRADGVVLLVPLTGAGEIVLVEQYRPPVRQRVLELPAGLVGDGDDNGGESFGNAARRELLEETGYEAGRLVRLTEGPPSAGLAAELVVFYLAPDVVRVGPGGGDRHEDITVHTVPLEAAGDWLAAREVEGLLVDSKVWAGLWFATA